MLFKSSTEVVEGAYAIFDPAVPMLDKLLQARISKLQALMLQTH